MKIRLGLCISMLSIALFFSNCTSIEKNTQQDEIIAGVKIYEHEGDYNELFTNWKDIGINTIFGSVELLSNEEFKKLAKANGIKTFAIFPIFYAAEELERDSTIYAITQYGNRAEKEWVKFACPSDEKFIRAKIGYIKNFVDSHKPSGISLDFIRHFVFWEKIYPNTVYNSLPNTCFDDRCISKFCIEINISLPDGVSTEYEIYKWIKKNHYENWVRWKSGLITETVEKIVSEVKKTNPDIIVNLHAVPWRKDDFNGAIKKVVGQDFESLSEHVDYISPMTYSHMVKREPKWINAVVKDIHENSNAKVLPSIQVGIAYLSDTLSSVEFKECLKESLKAPSSGVVFWNWKALSLEKEKLEIVKMYLPTVTSSAGSKDERGL